MLLSFNPLLLLYYCLLITISFYFTVFYVFYVFYSSSGELPSLRLCISKVKRESRPESGDRTVAGVCPWCRGYGGCRGCRWYGGWWGCRGCVGGRGAGYGTGYGAGYGAGDGADTGGAGTGAYEQQQPQYAGAEGEARYAVWDMVQKQDFPMPYAICHTLFLYYCHLILFSYHLIYLTVL
jgi:hypothetical protein